MPSHLPASWNIAFRAFERRMKDSTRVQRTDGADQFQKITSGLQSIAVSIAVLVGGAWTLYSFVTTKTAEKAYYDIQIAEKNLQIAEKNAERQGQVSTMIETTPMPAVASGKFAMLIRVAVENKGDYFIPLLLDKPNPMRLSHLGSSQGSLFGTKQYFPLPYNNYQPRSQDNGYMENFMLWPNSRRVIEYYAELDDTGIYNVSFYFQAKGSFFDATVRKEIAELTAMPQSTTPGLWVGTHVYAMIPAPVTGEKAEALAKSP
jgi:hypothetical protein